MFGGVSLKKIDRVEQLERSRVKPSQTVTWFLTVSLAIEHDHCNDHPESAARLSPLLHSTVCFARRFLLNNPTTTKNRRIKHQPRKKCSLWVYPSGPFPTNELSPD